VLNEKLEPMSEKDISEILEDETDTKQWKDIKWIDSDLDDEEYNGDVSDIWDDSLNFDDENKFRSDIMKNWANS
jgi:hypothetical protein